MLVYYQRRSCLFSVDFLLSFNRYFKEGAHRYKNYLVFQFHPNVSRWVFHKKVYIINTSCLKKSLPE